MLSVYRKGQTNQAFNGFPMIGKLEQILLCQYQGSTMVGFRAGLLGDILRPEDPFPLKMFNHGTYKFAEQTASLACTLSALQAHWIWNCQRQTCMKLIAWLDSNCATALIETLFSKVENLIAVPKGEFLSIIFFSLPAPCVKMLWPKRTFLVDSPKTTQPISVNFQTVSRAPAIRNFVVCGCGTQLIGLPAVCRFRGYAVSDWQANPLVVCPYTEVESVTYRFGLAWVLII